jgi:hypothetical protein
MKLVQIIDFLNAIQRHYQSDNFDDSNLFSEEDVIKLYLKNGSIQDVFKTLVLKYEENVVIDEPYINQVFDEFNINPEDANVILNEKSIPKEPSFSRKALIKKPSFSKESKEIKSITDLQEKSDNAAHTKKTIKKIEDESDGGLNLISFLIPLVGIIYYAVNQDNKPLKSKAALTSSLVAVVLFIVIYLIQ